MRLDKGIEVGNIFKLGTDFTEKLGATFLAEDGSRHHVIMGSYGIGLGRAMACIVEAHHDEKGIVWPEAGRRTRSTWWPSAPVRTRRWLRRPTGSTSA